MQLDQQARRCLMSAAQLKAGTTLIDLRSSQAYSAFHIPGATNQQLNQLLSQRPRDAVVYDGGRLAQDSALLCERLQRYGLANVRVLEGGIAAWAQSNRDTHALEVSRLEDGEITSALLAGRTSVVALSPGFNAVLASLRPQASHVGAQELALANNAEEVSARLAQRRSGRTLLYWIGEPQRLQTLLQTLLVQDHKRESGPGYSPTCSAL
ncbi:MAG TPA: rhodanese-like domain-containing protein [Stenotrophomonas sp.]